MLQKRKDESVRADETRVLFKQSYRHRPCDCHFGCLDAEFRGAEVADLADQIVAIVGYQDLTVSGTEQLKKEGHE